MLLGSMAVCLSEVNTTEHKPACCFILLYLPHLSQRNHTEIIASCMLCWLRFLPQTPIISRSDGDAEHPQERVLGQCKWPLVWRNFPRLRSLPWVGGVWDPWCVWFQTTLTIFIAGKCKGSNETLPLLLHPGWERSRGHLNALPVVIPRDPPASPFLLHYQIPLREGASFSFNLVIGKKIKLKIWKAQWLLFSFLCGKFAVLYPRTIQKQNDFTCISFALLFPSPTRLCSDYWTTLSLGLLMLIKTTQSH